MNTDANSSLTDEQIVARAAPTKWDEVRVSTVRALHRLAIKEGNSILSAHCQLALSGSPLVKNSLTAIASAVNSRAKTTTKVKKDPCWPTNKQSTFSKDDVVPCRKEDLAPGDYVKVGGLLKQVKLVIGGTDVKTVDGRYYGERNLQSYLKIKKA